MRVEYQKNKLMKKLATASMLLVLVLSGCSRKEPGDPTRMDEMWGESTVKSDALESGRAKLFDESNYSMFIHWGLYSLLGGNWEDSTYYGIGEWIMNPRVANIPPEEYKKIATEFNPVDFDGMAIAQLAKDVGMKYIIITSKHHDGFAMFKSEADPFNIVDATPFGRDPMEELSTACRELGLGFGFYYSHYQDWTAPGGGGGPEFHPDGSPATFEDYFYAKCLPQVKEICTNYGQIDFVWFDTPQDMKKELVLKLAEVVRELQPQTMLCSRIGHGMGDYETLGDMEVPPRNHDGLWETCDTHNDSWSYAWYDNNFKSPGEILNRLIATIARGGTYLFNVGPDGSGKVPEISREFLLEAGEWIGRYPQLIYNAGSSPWGHAQPWGDVTTNGNSLFLSVFQWPTDGKLYLPGLEDKLVEAQLLNPSGASQISHEQQKGWTILRLPARPVDFPVSVIELKLESEAKKTRVNTNLAIYPNMDNQLLVEFADISGAVKDDVRWMEKFGEWKHVIQVSQWEEEGKAEWIIEVFEPGYYYLDLCYNGEGRLVWKTKTDEGIRVQNLVEGNPETSSLESVLIRPINN
jgi:alpha-L-fucosidase